MKKPREVTAEERRHWRQELGLEPRDPAPAKPGVPEAKPIRRKAPAPPLAVQTGRAAQRALKPFGRPQATLDLHGLGKIEAYGLVQEFLAQSQVEGARHVIIITGKGREPGGVLRENLPHWLNEPALRGLVGGIAQATPDKGGSGVFHVLLKRS